MLDQFTLALSYFKLPINSNVIVACSGGSDSIALLTLMGETAKKHQLNTIVAYFNHHLRPSDEIDKDIEVIQLLSLQYNLKLEIASADPAYWLNNSKNIEAQARSLRYHFFNQLSTQFNAKAVLLAHTQDDQMETIYMRLLSFSGLAGLKAISRQNKLFIRPLLNFTKESLRLYLREHNVKWHEDYSNQSNNFWRNQIRTEIIRLKNINQRWPKALLSLASRAQDTVDLIDYSLIYQDTFTTYETNKISYTPLSNFITLPSLLQKSIFFKWFVLLRKGNIEKDYRLPERFFNNLNYFKQGSILLQGHGVKLHKNKNYLIMSLT